MNTLNGLVEIQTDRLRLRQWKLSDVEPFVALNANPEVMEYFPSVLSPQKSELLAATLKDRIARKGWGFWAVENLSTGEFMGTTGLERPSRKFEFSPCIEVAWRYDRKYWGQGFASEAAAACLKFGFNTLRLKRIVSFTAVSNSRSIKVMERIGMKNQERNFKHPNIDAASSLSEHVLFAAVPSDLQ